MLRHRARLKRAVEADPEPSWRAAAMAVLEDARHASLIDGMLSGSAFLADLAAEHPRTLVGVLAHGSAPVLEEILADLAGRDPPPERSRLMTELRRARKRVALAVALADLSGAWSLERVTDALTQFADLAVERTLHRLLLDAAEREEILLDPDDPVGRSGLVVLAMGKYGAGELNYSCDIDLIVLFEPEWFRVRGRRDAGGSGVPGSCAGWNTCCTEKTGTVTCSASTFACARTPPGHPLALPVEAAEIYYERHRPELGARRVDQGARRSPATSTPARVPGACALLWRKYLDFAAIADIHSIKRQINAYRGSRRSRCAGHDVKVGRGGIREIEFFAQTQQLILGGRDAGLRLPADRRGARGARRIALGRGRVPPRR